MPIYGMVHFITRVQECKYLGCVVDEYLGYKSMIEARAKAGMKAHGCKDVGRVWES